MASHKAAFLAGIGLLSAALLALEVFFVRLVSILLYPAATYLVISLALLGFGVSGAALALRRRPEPPAAALASWGALAFGLAALAACALMWTIGRQPGMAAWLPLALGLPFALGGLAIAVALSRPEAPVSQVYFADLLGAGLGAGLVLLGLRYLTGAQVAGLIGAAGALAAALLGGGPWLSRGAAILAAAIALGGLLIRPAPGIVPIASKELGLYTALGPEVRWEYQGWSPLARVDVVSLPGDRIELPQAFDYKLVTQDGGAPTLLLNLGNAQAADFAEQTVMGLPYWLRQSPSVFIIGLGGGADVQAALRFGARRVTGVEINPQMIALAGEVFAEFIGRPYADPRVHILQGDGRSVVRRSAEQYDILQLTGVDTTVASPGANPNLAENYLYTVEAFDEYLQHLTSDGLLSVSFPEVTGLSLRLTALAWEALQRQGAADPAAHLAVSRTGGFVHVLVKRSPLTPAETAELQARLDRPLVGVYFPLYHRLFGTAFNPANELLYAAGRVETGPHAELVAAYRAGRGAAWLAAQNRDLRPPTDDRPFFFVLDRWGEYAPNLEALWLTLALLAAATLMFLLIPPLALQRRGLRLPGAPALAVYFVALGLAYIAFEVNLIQKLSLFLGHPAYALAVTLCVLLAASGLGSLVSGRLALAEDRRVALACVGAAGLAAAGAFGLAPVFEALGGLPLAARVLAAAALTALPGFLMGMPFPTGLAAVRRGAPAFVPWAWALNGSGTVLGTIAAVLLAMQAGFTAVFLAAGCLYLLALAAFTLFWRTTKIGVPDGEAV